ncbi:MAG: DUF1707 domain-containing protein, partial [Nonomuraea sp.]|nr:DUF1707 domain-containing protein [Nonomuraea sp.]
MRVSDVDRDTTAREVQQAFAEGRLSSTEMDERLER